MLEEKRLRDFCKMHDVNNARFLIATVQSFLGEPTPDCARFRIGPTDFAELQTSHGASLGRETWTPSYYMCSFKSRECKVEEDCSTFCKGVTFALPGFLIYSPAGARLF